MARNRQQAKQRQAERRARRLEQQRASGAPDGAGAARRESEPEVEPTSPAPGILPEISLGAPPPTEGRSDAVLEEEPELDDDEHLTEEEIEAEEEAERELSGRGDEGYQAVGRRGEAAAAHAHRPRVVQFLVAVWAELQRVQWPDRQALTTLTGVVLGFVLIAGGYLGLLDAIFSRIIQAIL